MDISGKELIARKFKTKRNITENIPAFYMKKEV